MFRALFAVVLLMIVGLLAPTAGQVRAGEIRVATATNFKSAMTALSQRFEARTGHRVTLIFGSTGKHYAQIRQGAPFDLFFAADSRRPGRLAEQGLGLPDTRFTYARGKLVLWGPIKGDVGSAGKVLEQGEFDHLAIANPRLAPYGRAAQEVLQTRGLWQALEGRLVQGENIGQAFHFVHSGNAELGFVAWSQVKGLSPSQGFYWMVPQALYAPIEQQALLLKESKAGRAFLVFVQSDEGARIIRDHGYDPPLDCNQSPAGDTARC